MKLSWDIIGDAAKKINLDKVKSSINNSKDGKKPSGGLLALIIATDMACARAISEALELKKDAEAKEVTKDQFMDASRKAIDILVEKTNIGDPFADFMTEIEATVFCADLAIELYGKEGEDGTAESAS